MNSFTRNILDLHDLESLALGSNTINKLHPTVKIVVTILYIVIVVATGKYELNRAIFLGIYPVFILSLTDVPLKRFASKLLIPALLSISLGIVNPFFDREIVMMVGPLAVSGGVLSFVTLFVKAIMSISASLLLVATTTMSDITKGLQVLKMPKPLTMLLLLMYRYIGILLSETSRTIDAYELRGSRGKGIHISSWGSLVGQILIRSYRRSEEIYEAMCLRGYGVGGDYE